MEFIKFIIAAIFYYSGLLDLIIYFNEKRSGNRKPLILLYHRVLEDDDPEMFYSIKGMTVTTDVFEAQMEFLKRRFRILSLSKLRELIENGNPLPHRSVVITFDDGWRDNYQNAWPILKKLGIPAAIYLTVGLIETGDKVWFNKAIMIFKSGKPDADKIMKVVRSICKNPPPPSEYPHDIVGFVDMLKPYSIKLINDVVDHLIKESCPAENEDRKYRNMLSWDEIVEMKLAGIEFGSHGMSHGILPHLTRDEIRRELIDSKRIMEAKLENTIETFAFPNGDYNSEIIADAREAGYKCCLATESGIKQEHYDLYNMPRIGIHTGASIGPMGHFSKSIFMLRISGLQIRFKGK